MPIVGAILVPHPPIIIPTVGRGREAEVQDTIDAYRTAAKQAAAWSPEVLIITSPHTVMYADYFHISPGKSASGDMSAFGAPQTKLKVVYDTELRQELVCQAEAAGIQAGTLGKKTHPWTTGPSSLCTFSGRQGSTAPFCGSDCPASPRWSTTGWASASPGLRTLWAAGRCLWPVATCPTS